MTISHHPDIATLMCCSAGSQPEARAAVIASHLACCAECRAEVARMEKIGAVLFDEIKPADVSCAAPVIAMRAGEQDAGTAQDGIRVRYRCCKAEGGDVPGPLAALIGPRLDDLSWRWVAPGVRSSCVPLSEGCCGDLRLFKVSPGKSLPEHDHVGPELTLVLRGSYTDEHGTFRQGDVADLEAGGGHAPVACPREGCICLTASEEKVRFKSWPARLLQKLFRL